MQNKFAEGSPRKLSPTSLRGLSNEAREALSEAFEAMSNWRIETANISEKNSEQVIEKMDAAARALGWPEQIVEATRAQLQSITRAQIQTMDQVMDAWEEQIKLPNSETVSPAAMLSKLTSLPSFGPAGNWPTIGPFQMAGMNPFQVWLQFAEQWQKVFEAMTYQTRAGEPRHRAEPHRR
jgi:hypothetical protein